MSEALPAAWQRLTAEVRRVAPGSAALLRPPQPWAEPVGLPVPLSQELRTWFQLHDGCGMSVDGRILPLNCPLSLPEAVESTLMVREIWQSTEDGQEALAGATDVAGEVAEMWLDQYVMIAEDGGGGGLLVDLRPGPLHGCVRWWDETGADEGEVLAAGLAELCDAVAQALGTGEPVGGYAPLLGDGLLDWG